MNERVRFFKEAIASTVQPPRTEPVRSPSITDRLAGVTPEQIVIEVDPSNILANSVSSVDVPGSPILNLTEQIEMSRVLVEDVIMEDVPDDDDAGNVNDDLEQLRGNASNGNMSRNRLEERSQERDRTTRSQDGGGNLEITGEEMCRVGIHVAAEPYLLLPQKN